MEKKYPLYGLDVSETTSPLEAGLGWAVDLDAEPFIGRDALRRQRDEGVDRLLTGIELPDLSHVPGRRRRRLGRGRPRARRADLDRSRLVPREGARHGVPARDPSVGNERDADLARRPAAGGVTTHRPFYDPDGTRVRA